MNQAGFLTICALLMAPLAPPSSQGPIVLFAGVLMLLQIFTWGRVK